MALELTQKRIEANRKNALLAGRPKGKLNRLTVLKEKARIGFETDIAKMARKLTSAQAIAAVGTHKMIRIFMRDGVKATEIIRDEKRMEDLLINGVYGKDYIIVEGRPGDYRAANALLDRTFGKAKENIKLDGEVKFSLIALAQRAEQMETIDNEVIDE